jgi:hypothetical protein
MLTDADKEIAKELGLTHAEMRIAKATRIPPERYAYHKAEIEAGRVAGQERGKALSDVMLERAGRWPEGRGRRPFPKDPPPEDGG